MFDFNLSSKRTRLALRFFTYGVMTVASVVLTTILVFVALGYRFDKNFNFSQGGLVQFRSLPSDAAVSIDGKMQSFRTPDKTNLPAGQHAFMMQRDGYHTWSKTADLAAGQLLWLNYARLIPNTISTTTIKEYGSVEKSLGSPDKHWMLLHVEQHKPDFALVDYSDEKKPVFKDLQLPDDIFTKKDGTFGTFKILEWDLQSKYVLVEHENGDTVEFARIDRSKPADSVNLTKLFGLDIKDAHFSGNNANIIYAKTSDVLRRLDVGAASASAALVDNLRTFVVYGGDTIAYTNMKQVNTGDDTTAKQQVGIYRGGKIIPVRDVAADAQVRLAYNEYDNHSYLAINSGTDSKTDIIRDATATGSSQAASVYAQLDLDRAVTWLSFSSSGRMLLAQNGKHMATYDLETAKSATKTVEAGTDDVAQLRWLDDFYLWTDAGSKLRIFEFDGTNEHELTAITPGFDVMLSSNGERLLSIKKNDAGKFDLRASKLVLDND